ncbi:MAG: hypothetical protein JOY59_14475 [Candidatus Eremiobacteraeota bacterium]|nr:hypothetical protein [Candidatus Eremiobacteraeota bacterium]
MPWITVVGAIIGAGIGAAYDNWSVGLIYGIIAGACVGAYLDRRITSKSWIGR